MSSFHLLDLPADRLEAEVVAAFFFEDERPLRGPAALLDWRLNGPLTELLIRGDATGCPGENLLFRTNGKIGAEWVLFVGGGSWRGLKKTGYGRLVQTMIGTCREAGFSRIALALRSDGESQRDHLRRVVSDSLEEFGDALQCSLVLDTTDPPHREVLERDQIL